MDINGLNLNTGDNIVYFKAFEHKRLRNRRLEGTITQITDSIITVDLGRYRESISIQDLACGAIKVMGIPEIKVTTSAINSPYRPTHELRRRDVSFL